jgi:hypothetical protein
MNARTEYIGTWIDNAKQKKRAALALCPDGQYRTVSIPNKNGDELPLPAYAELLIGDDFGKVSGQVRLVLDNLVFEPADERLWTQRHDRRAS